jgi:PAS domain S-box-containing protein
MGSLETDHLSLKIKDLENRLLEAEELIEAIKAGEVDAFAVGTNNQTEVYTIQSGDYAYRVLIEKFSEGALNLTEDGLIVYTNVYFSELVGIPYEKVMGSLIFDLVHPDYQKEFKALFDHAKGGNSKGEIYLKVNNRTIPVYVSLTSLQPRLATVGMIVTDLTEKKHNERVILKYQDELEGKIEDLRKLSKSDKLKSDFIKMASHELNTPVTSIRGYIQMLLAMFSEKPLQKDIPQDFVASSLNTINKQVQRLIRLISELLDLSRIEGGQLELRKEIFNISEMVHETIQDIKMANLNRDINLYVNTDCNVDADKDRISQVLSNLIMNAIKYSGHSKSIDVTINANGNNVAIEIKDQGIGIDSEDIGKIFERFYRSKKNNVETYPGFGIGLFISKEIMQRHNGTILVESSNGNGSTFTVILPTVQSS